MDIRYTGEVSGKTGGRILLPDRKLGNGGQGFLYLPHGTGLLSGGQPGAGGYRAYRPPVYEERPLVMIPYFAWANRGENEMAVWFPAADSLSV